MSMLRRCAGRLLARPGRYHTGLADLPAIDNAREVLTSLYKRQIEVCMSYEGEKQFNSSVINMARHHLSIMDKYPSDWDVEYEINMGPLEGLITIAEDQLELIDVVNNEIKPSLNFNKAESLAAARASSDPYFGQFEQTRNLVFHPTPAGVPSAVELGPFPCVPYAGWPYVPPPKGWKYGDGHRRENWEEATEAWVASLGVSRQKLVSKYMAEHTPEEREAVKAAVAEAAKLALANYYYTADKKPEGYDEAVKAAADNAISLDQDRAIYYNRLYDDAVARAAAKDTAAPVPLTVNEEAFLKSNIGIATEAVLERYNIPAPSEPIKF